MLQPEIARCYSGACNREISIQEMFVKKIQLLFLSLWIYMSFKNSLDLALLELGGWTSACRSTIYWRQGRNQRECTSSESWRSYSRSRRRRTRSFRIWESPSSKVGTLSYGSGKIKLRKFSKRLQSEVERGKEILFKVLDREISIREMFVKKKQLSLSH